ncbi:hypothetical protein MRB53_037999 [Persea americana]|nr:hypothetical protein MRB53_037999 [Persea americana]
MCSSLSVTCGFSSSPDRSWSMYGVTMYIMPLVFSFPVLFSMILDNSADIRCNRSTAISSSRSTLTLRQHLEQLDFAQGCDRELPVSGPDIPCLVNLSAAYERPFALGKFQRYPKVPSPSFSEMSYCEMLEQPVKREDILN